MDHRLLPHCLWTVENEADGRVEEPGIATVCMGVALGELTLEAIDLERPSLGMLAEINERAYQDETGVFGYLARKLVDERIAVCGLRVEGKLVCVALGLTVGDDLICRCLSQQQLRSTDFLLLIAPAAIFRLSF